MSLREYEFTYIVKADLPDAEKKKTIEKYETMLTQDGGQVIKKADWGVKKLAYPIKRQYRGHYVHYDFVGLPEHVTEVERLMRIDDGILRFLSIRINDEVDVEKRKAEIAKYDAKVRASKEKKH